MMGTKIVISNILDEIKNRRFNFVLFFLAILVTSNWSYGNFQVSSSTIRVGQSIPEIAFHNVLDSDSTEFSTKELGKPTILYFFSAVCRASFSHFSEIDKIYSLYQHDFDLMMVGIDLDDDVQDMYQAYSRKYNLSLPIAFDKFIYKQYNIRGVPHVIWINEKGIVQAITNVLDQGYLEKFIKGKEFDFISYDPDGNERLRKFDPNEPFLVNGNGGEARNFTQRSLLAEWKIGMPNEMPYSESNKSPLEGLKYLQVIGRELADLYRIAYFGKTYGWHPGDSAYGNYHYSLMLEVENKSKFESDYNLGKNLFCYSQILSPDKRTPGQMMKVMQTDLMNYFGYKAVVETRQMPYLSLVATDNARKKLVNHDEFGESSYSLTNVHHINSPVSGLISILSYYLNLTLNDLPLIDETGIQGNFDLNFSAIMTDLGEVKTALQKQGLDIIRKEKPMKVIVIREP